MIICCEIWYVYSKGACYMDIIGKVITFIMSTISNLIGSRSAIDDIKKGFKENFKKNQ